MEWLKIAHPQEPKREDTRVRKVFALTPQTLKATDSFFTKRVWLQSFYVVETYLNTGDPKTSWSTKVMFSNFNEFKTWVIQQNYQTAYIHYSAATSQSDMDKKRRNFGISNEPGRFDWSSIPMAKIIAAITP